MVGLKKGEIVNNLMKQHSKNKNGAGSPAPLSISSKPA